MRKGTFFTSRNYLENIQFDLNNPVTNRDNCLYPAYLLRQRFMEAGLDLSTQDINPPHEAEFVIYNEMPLRGIELAGERKYVILLECEAIKPDNWDRGRHREFDKIFTWHDGLVDNKRYFKINFSVQFPSVIERVQQAKEKFCVMIVAQKYVRHPQELYTERVRAIRWFEENHPSEFDLYGMGWDRFVFSGAMKKLNKLDFLTRALKPDFPSYRGRIDLKKEVLKKYKFAICYENAQGIPGYITEKIFDCFFAGCVPIYWGPPNVTEHIWPDTFIAKNRFKTYEALYEYLNGMSETEYNGYLTAIGEYLKSDQARRFSARYFADTVTSEVLKDFNTN